MSDFVSSDYDSKVHRVSTKYGLASVDGELRSRYTREEDRHSLRQLAAYFNREVLRSAMERAGLDPLDGEVENMYRLLTDEETSAGVRTQARNRLERCGVDVDDLTGDFVTYQSINRHLKERLGVEYQSARPPGESEQTRGKNRILALRNRLAAVTETTLRRLASRGDISLGEFDIMIDVNVACPDCGAYLSVREVFDRGGCDCDS